MRIRNIIICLAACMLPLTAVAQSPPRSDTATETQLWEAMRAGKWRDALVAYNRLSLPETRHVFLAAQAHYNLAELEKSADVLGELIEKNPEHIAALYMLARIRARQLRWDEVRTLLQSCAHLGQSVLRDMCVGEDREAFKPLLEDSYFLVSIMRTTGSWQPEIDGVSSRDPFQPPAPGTKPLVDPDDPQVLARVDSARAEVEALLEDFHALSRDPEPDVELLLTKLGELRSALERLQAIDHPAISEIMKRFRREFARVKGLVNPLQLQLYVADGNQHLRAMAGMLRDEDYADVVERFARLEELVEQMRAEPLEVFHANAEQLYVRGKGLADRARKLLEVSRLALEVTGIVVAPDPEPSRAVINDVIYEVGDVVQDPDTGNPIEGLEIQSISQSAVTFALGQLRFVRALKAR